MPDDQSIFDEKNHLNFSALVKSKIAGIVFKRVQLQSNKKTPKCCQLPDFCQNDENSKNGKNSSVENACPLATTSTNSLPAPWQKIGCKSTQVGDKFFMQIPGDVWGGVVREKIDSCMIKVIA